jgi:hypothetical protein
MVGRGGTVDSSQRGYGRVRDGGAGGAGRARVPPLVDGVRIRSDARCYRTLAMSVIDTCHDARTPAIIPTRIAARMSARTPAIILTRIPATLPARTPTTLPNTYHNYLSEYLPECLPKYLLYDMPGYLS